MSKTQDKTGWNRGRKSEKGKGRHLFSCSLRSFRKKLKLMHPERGRKVGKKLKARNICNSLRKRNEE